MVENYVKVIGEASGAKSQNTEWFSSDLQEQAVNEQFGASKFRVTLAISSEVKVQLTLDSGTTWVYFNEDSALKADSIYVFDVPVRQGDTFNMRTNDSAGTTVRFCRVSEVSMEG
jgi:hypothetical protein